MDIKKKVINALMGQLDAEYVRLDDEDGITGFVVSPKFRDMPTLDRQGLIEHALSKAKEPLTPLEQRQVLMIAGVTPEEYESVGARIRVHKVKEMAGGTLKILLHGGHSDAEYVRKALKNQMGIQTTEPKQVSGEIEFLMSFRAKGNGPKPLTKAKAIKILKGDPYIEVLTNA